MAGYEWKKLLRYRRGGWIVLVLLLAELASILLFTRPFDRNLEENRSVYNEYLAQVEGPLTPEKREWIEGEMKQDQRRSQRIRGIENRLLYRRSLRGGIPATICGSAGPGRPVSGIFQAVQSIYFRPGTAGPAISLYRRLGDPAGEQIAGLSAVAGADLPACTAVLPGIRLPDGTNCC